jgi:hypothetical protein
MCRALFDVAATDESTPIVYGLAELVPAVRGFIRDIATLRLGDCDVNVSATHRNS